MTKLTDIAGTWAGSQELWLDQMQNVAETCACTVEVSADAIAYRWSYQDKPQTGTLAVAADGRIEFRDTWHMPDGMTLAPSLS